MTSAELVERVALVERMLEAFAHASGLGIFPDEEDEEWREDLINGMSAALRIALEEAALELDALYLPHAAAAIRALIPSGNIPAHHDDTDSK